MMIKLYVIIEKKTIWNGLFLMIPAGIYAW